jgi:protein TonB
MNASHHRVTSEAAAGALAVSALELDLVALRDKPLPWTYRLRVAAIVVVSLGVHAAILLQLDPRPEVTQVEEETPIEMIFEQPQQEQAPPPPPPVAESVPPEPTAQPILEPPATDFARKAEQDREDGQASEAAAAETAAQVAAQPEQKPAPEPPPPPDPVPALLAAPPPAERPAPRFTGLTPLPDFQFTAPQARRSELPAGTAQPGYLSTLYGLIIRQMPKLPPDIRPARGRVTFGVLSNGHIFQEVIAIPSGAPFLDAAALAAVRKASPFPVPPNGGPIYIRFEYGSD